MQEDLSQLMQQGASPLLLRCRLSSLQLPRTASHASDLSSAALNSARSASLFAYRFLLFAACSSLASSALRMLRMSWIVSSRSMVSLISSSFCIMAANTSSILSGSCVQRSFQLRLNSTSPLHCPLTLQSLLEMLTGCACGTLMLCCDLFKVASFLMSISSIQSVDQFHGASCFRDTLSFSTVPICLYVNTDFLLSRNNLELQHA